MGVGSREKPDQFVSECGSVDLDLADEGCTGKPCGTGTLHIVEFRVAAEAHLRERSVLLEDRTAKPGGTGTTCAVETARSVNGRVHELNVTDKRCVFEPSVTDVAFAEIKVYKGCVSQVKVDIRPKDVPGDIGRKWSARTCCTVTLTSRSSIAPLSRSRRACRVGTSSRTAYGIRK